MKEIEHNGFTHPTTLNGKALLFLFSSPIILLAIRFVFLFLETFLSASYKILFVSEPVEKALPSNQNIIVLYIKGFVQLLMNLTYTYFDMLLTLSVITFFIFMIFRFRRNGLISKHDWLNIISISSLIFITYPIRPILYEIYENTFTLESVLNFHFIIDVIMVCFYFASMLILSHFIFVKAPHAIEAQYKTAPKDFFKHNAMWLVNEIKHINITYIVIVLLMIVGYLFFMGF